MKRQELERLLKKAGYVLMRQNKHALWFKTGSPNVVLPRHKDINKMITRDILKQLNKGE
jgi:predicted RNA binding protein YcfA (HicA-like mRNA interferase family)